MDGDVFGVGELRRRVLDAWTASPARFREDANAEEELALGGYRDRLVVELAQNAADAAARAGVPGRLRLTLRDGTLVAANTGAHLDAAGVESLATLRASAKRDEDATVGRFGVGFAAVLTVSDEPAVVSHGGGVRWSLAEARELAAAVPGLAEELRRRDGHVPLLRLPFAAEGAAPAGYDTAVVLPLRDAAARELADRLLAGVDDALLLALPGLSEVTVETAEGERTLTRRADGPWTVIGDRRWRVASAHGVTDPALLADRPVEERGRPVWTVTWAVPVDGSGAPVRPEAASVVHAPTPTDEPLGVPALLIASFPLESTRRHTAPGPLTDFLLDRAADTYTELLRDWHPVGPGVIDLVPGPLGRGELDGALRARLLERLPGVPFLPSAAPADEPDGAEGADGRVGAEGGPLALRPRDAEIAEGAGSATVAVLAELFPSLLPAGLERRTELRTLEVPRIPLGEVIDRLAGIERDPAWWRRLYDSLAGVDPDRLTGLPVPLADGRTTIGPRHVLLPLPDLAGAERLARLGLKVAYTEAAHPLLEKLGAVPATPRAVLTTPQVRGAVAASLDADEVWDEDGSALDPEELTDLVLGLVRDAGLAPGDEPWLAALALPDEDGEPVPAGELAYPGSPFATVLREGELPLCDRELAERWGEQTLTAVGVLADFPLVRAADVVLDPDEFEPRDTDYPEPDDAGLLDAVDVWCEDVLDQLPDTPVPPVATELLAVRDLDLVDDDCWPQALALLARPPLRDALTTPVRVLLPDGTAETVRSYTAWWLRGHPVLDGRRPAGLRAAGGDPLLAGLYEEADASGFDDPALLHALGVRTSAAALLDEPGGAAELLGRLADAELPVGPAQLHGLYSLLAELDPDEVTLPDEVRAVVDGRVRVVDAEGALVADAPDLLPLAAGRALLPVRPERAARLAAVLDVGLLSEAVPAPAPGGGALREVPGEVRDLLGPDTPTSYTEHDELVVEGVELDWRLGPDGALHAATLEGLAAGLAWAAGAWPRRFEAAALLEDPERADELTVDRWFD
ncbi:MULTISPECIES: sacsin N-terminal ATP-binding-like domain-containing protein [unclassified Streptomyces]|uniref:sacsin N-terminal ATP-binding-like domain-containing protein n=1 Tax=unclassified Streptomyces TaxID=2593676 RepID=UPI0022B67A31|nr:MULTISPECIES: molecular chaperone Hsp90 [unclassified Streptomyces]MCZ7414885.1 molecular chaperone Hsp90 [Streptomyces sp. WMMC897]MCZ7431828.1 molecular chaperone Hsp90 [Streptomyces sp. WMMC1477]